MQRRVAYQYLNRSLDPVADPPMLRQMLLKDLRKNLQLDDVEYANIRIIEQRPFPYMTKFTPKSLRERRPWRILEQQGKRSTFWIGSSVCFESVLDVVVYNNNLVDRIIPT